MLSNYHGEFCNVMKNNLKNVCTKKNQYICTNRDSLLVIFSFFFKCSLVTLIAQNIIMQCNAVVFSITNGTTIFL